MNFMKADIGKKVINKRTKAIGNFISRCDEPSFNIQLENGRSVGGGINSPYAQDWEIVEEDNWKLADNMGVLNDTAGIALIDFKTFIQKVKRDVIKLDNKGDDKVDYDDVFDIIDKRAGKL